MWVSAGGLRDGSDGGERDYSIQMMDIGRYRRETMIDSAVCREWRIFGGQCSSDRCVYGVSQWGR